MEDVLVLAEACPEKGSEDWLPVPGYEGWYDVSNLGNVRRVRGGKGARLGSILKPQRHGGHYLWVDLSKQCMPKRYAIHTLVALAFLGPPTAPMVNHISGNTLNNRPGNLEYVTHAQNIQHAFMIGLNNHYGEQHYKARLTEDQVRAIRFSTEGARGIAKRYGVSRGAIRAVKEGRTWKHVA